MGVPADIHLSPVSLERLLEKQRSVELSLDIVLLLLEQAGVGLHPDQILLYSSGKLEIQPGEPTPGYRAPEYQGQVQPLQDVYVAGVIFYELLSGKKLGQLPEREMLHAGALNRVLDELPGFSPDIYMLLRAMLAFRPESRLSPQLAKKELRELRGTGAGLNEQAQSLVLSAKRSATLIPDEPPAATLIPDEAPAPQPWKPLPVDEPPPKPARASQYMALGGFFIFLAVGTLCGGIGVGILAFLVVVFARSPAG
jgi:serine/threonine protein kinase